jgi:hypothetical protein
MERSDGVVQALFEISELNAKRSMFLKPQDSVYGIRVDSVSLTGTVSIVRRDGTATVMRSGSSEQIMEER